MASHALGSGGGVVLAEEQAVAAGVAVGAKALKQTRFVELELVPLEFVELEPELVLLEFVEFAWVLLFVRVLLECVELARVLLARVLLARVWLARVLLMAVKFTLVMFPTKLATVELSAVRLPGFGGGVTVVVEFRVVGFLGMLEDGGLVLLVVVEIPAGVGPARLNDPVGEFPLFEVLPPIVPPPIGVVPALPVVPAPPVVPIGVVPAPPVVPIGVVPAPVPVPPIVVAELLPPIVVAELLPPIVPVAIGVPMELLPEPDAPPIVPSCKRRLPAALPS